MGPAEPLCLWEGRGWRDGEEGLEAALWGRRARCRSEEGRGKKAGMSGQEGGLAVGRLVEVVAGQGTAVEGASPSGISLLFSTPSSWFSCLSSQVGRRRLTSLAAA